MHFLSWASVLAMWQSSSQLSAKGVAAGLEHHKYRVNAFSATQRDHCIICSSRRSVDRGAHRDGALAISDGNRAGAARNACDCSPCRTVLRFATGATTTARPEHKDCSKKWYQTAAKHKGAKPSKPMQGVHTHCLNCREGKMLAFETRVSDLID